MRTPLIAVPVAAAALVVAGVLGSAAAQDPASPPTPARAIVANGAAQRMLDSSASDAQLRGAYDDALHDAIADAKRKAAILAGDGGVALGAVQRVTEQSNTMLGGCAYGPIAYADGATAKAAPVPTRKPARKPKKKKPAKAAEVETYPCAVQAAVAITFAAG